MLNNLQTTDSCPKQTRAVQYQTHSNPSDTTNLSYLMKMEKHVSTYTRSSSWSHSLTQVVFHSAQTCHPGKDIFSNEIIPRLLAVYQLSGGTQVVYKRITHHDKYTVTGVL